MSFISILGWDKIIEKTLAANHRIIIVLPAISDELCEVILRAKAKVKICINNKEAPFRNGYGDYKAIIRILDAGIEITQCTDNNISFFIFDNEGYSYFPESRIFTDILKPESLNAIRLDAVSIERLIIHFFPPKDDSEKYETSNKIEKAIEFIKLSIESIADVINIETSHPLSKSFNRGKFNEIVDSLKHNPPLHPDLQRKFKTYTTLIHLVEMSFIGAKIDKKRVSLPKQTIPSQSKELQKIINSTLELFNKTDFKTVIPEYKELSETDKYIRRTFLHPLTCRRNKNILKNSQSVEFNVAVNEFRNKISSIKSSITDFVDRQKKRIIELLKSELKKYYSVYPPLKPPHRATQNHEEFIDEYISGVIVMIKFPTGKEIADILELNTYFYDFKWEDFEDKQLLAELKKKKIISGNDIKEMVFLQDAYKTKPE